jgi:HSP20 family protein
MMTLRSLEARMWAEALEAMERAERLRRQFFHRSRESRCWEAPCDIFETDEALSILFALPGVDPDAIEVRVSAGILIVSGERPQPAELRRASILRLEIPHGRFERRIELPPGRFELSGRRLANGCLMLRLNKL